MTGAIGEASDIFSAIGGNNIEEVKVFTSGKPGACQFEK